MQYGHLQTGFELRLFHQGVRIECSVKLYTQLNIANYNCDCNQITGRWFFRKAQSVHHAS